jgi:hypothetical protein
MSNTDTYKERSDKMRAGHNGTTPLRQPDQVKSRQSCSEITDLLIEASYLR